MQQPTAGNGQFQGSPIISNRVQPRRMPANRGSMFRSFMQRNQPSLFDRIGHQNQWGGRGQGAPVQAHGNHNPFQGGRNAWKTGWNGGGPNNSMPFPGGRPPIFGHHPMPPEHPPTAGGDRDPFHGGRNAWQGGQPPFGPTGPILGHGQTMNGMIQAIMGDLGQGINPAQFANMQGGSLPGGEHGDFLRALGGGDMNNSPLQALITHLIQGAPGADGAPGNYMINGDQGGAIAQILRQAIQNNPNFNPPRPPRGRPQFPMPGRTPGLPNTLFPLNPGVGGIPQAGLPR